MRPSHVGILLLLAGACTSTPDVTSLPPRLRTGDRPKPPLPRDPDAVAGELEVEPLELRGVSGGRIVFSLPGHPEQILEMLLDFGHAAGHRSWAERFKVLERTPDTVLARWQFHGRLGLNPSPDVAFHITRRADPIVVTFELRRASFGLAAFFGDYRIWARDAKTSYLAERTYLDSGLFFANASQEDVADGLREDAKQLRRWMAERLAASGSTAAR